MYNDVLIDSFKRIAKKLRISVTDRCNFRCLFCMPLNPVWKPKEEILTYEEIIRLTKIFSELGIEKIKITGGEPLLRPNIEYLIDEISKISGIKEISMTTNGYFLSEKARNLKDAGLNYVTISLHSLKRDRFNKITGKDVYDKVLEGVFISTKTFEKVKINTVIIKGYNEDEILDMVDFAIDLKLNLRFIEYMPFDGNRLWDLDKVVTGKEIIEKIKGKYDLVELPRTPGSTAKLFKIEDKTEIGIITSISEPFCYDCDRIRLTADGKFIPCMFSLKEYDLKTPLRKGMSDQEIKNLIKIFYFKKDEGVISLFKSKSIPRFIRAMYTLGG